MTASGEGASGNAAACATVNMRGARLVLPDRYLLPVCNCRVAVVWCGVVWCAVLCCAVLCCAVLCCAVLCCAVLCCAVLCCAVACCGVACWRQCMLAMDTVPLPITYQAPVRSCSTE